MPVICSATVSTEYLPWAILGLEINKTALPSLFMVLGPMGETDKRQTVGNMERQRQE